MNSFNSFFQSTKHKMHNAPHFIDRKALNSKYFERLENNAENATMHEWLLMKGRNLGPNTKLNFVLGFSDHY